MQADATQAALGGWKACIRLELLPELLGSPLLCPHCSLCAIALIVSLRQVGAVLLQAFDLAC